MSAVILPSLERSLTSPVSRKKILLSVHCATTSVKLLFPMRFLKKPTLLSVEEFEDMKSHPVIGAGIVRNIPNVEKFIGGIKHHHERWNGTGYPDRLKGENIPLLARIIALVDSFDAMTSGRTYIGFMRGDEAAERLTATGHELFDPEILKILCYCLHSRQNSKGTQYIHAFLARIELLLRKEMARTRFRYSSLKTNFKCTCNACRIFFKSVTLCV